MDKIFFESMLSKVEKPERVVVRLYENKYSVIVSAENTNDTLGWFHINCNVIEGYLQERGYSWCYLFETAPKQSPCIYMFIGEKLSKEFLEDDLKDEIESLPEGRNFYIEAAPFASIDVDQYDDSISELETELYNKASEVFKVYES